MLGMRLESWGLLAAFLMVSPITLADTEIGKKAYHNRDYNKALVEFGAAAKAGDPEGQTRLGVMFLRGEGVVQDASAAAALFEVAAKSGYVPAQFNLGRLYYSGNGVALNRAKAAKWFAEAGRQGDVLSAHALSVLYYDGAGVQKDVQKSISLARWAANAGLEDAQYQMGVFYFRGEGVRKNLPEAYYWFYIAWQRGMTKSSTMVAQLAEKLKPAVIGAAEYRAAMWEPKYDGNPLSE